MECRNSHLLLLLMGLFVCTVISQGVSSSKVMIGPCRRNNSLAGSGDAAPLNGFSPCEVVESDVILGGLIGFHRYDEKLGVCTKEFSAASVQMSEALRHAVELVNLDPHLLPNVTLGYEIRDTCRSSTHTLRQCLNFLQHDTDDQCVRDAAEDRRRVAGVVGSYTSSTSRSATRLLGLFQIPMVSYSATSPQLSDSESYPYFLRTIPSDALAGEAIGKMLRSLSWSFVGFVYSDDIYGRGYLEVVLKSLGLQESICTTERMSPEAAKVQDRCAAFLLKVSDTAQSDDRVFADIWKELLFAYPQRLASVVVLLTQAIETKYFFQYPRRIGGPILQEALKANKTFIGCDAWGLNQDVIRAEPDLAKGTLSPVPMTSPLPQFREHFVSLNPVDDADNPWLEELFQCEPSSGPMLPSDRVCERNTSLADDFSMSLFVPYVYHAVYAFAHALHQIYVQCDFDVSCLKKNATTSDNMLRALQAVRFKTVYDQLFQFAANGDPEEARYEIRNVQLDTDDRIVFPVAGHFIASGTFRQVNSSGSPTTSPSRSGTAAVLVDERPPSQYQETFHLDSRRVIWNDGTPSWPRSVCSVSCAAGHRRTLNSSLPPHLSCCWYCLACDVNTHAAHSNADECLPCHVTQSSTEDRTGCGSLKVRKFALPNPMPVITLVASVLGLLGCLYCCVLCGLRRRCYFPLGFVPTITCLVASALIYISAMLEAAGPTTAVCSLRTFLAAVGMALLASNFLMYACHRLSILHQSRFSQFLLSPIHRCILSGVLIVVQGIVLLLYFVSNAYPTAQTTVIDHVSITMACGFHSVDVTTTVYVIVVNVITSLIVGVCLYAELHEKSLVYVLDEQCTLLKTVLAASLLSAFLLSLISGLQTAVTHVTKDLFLHLSSLQYATAFLLLVFVRLVRKLSPMSQEQQAWQQDMWTSLYSLGSSSGRPTSGSCSDDLEGSADAPRLVVMTTESRDSRQITIGSAGSMESDREAEQTCTALNQAYSLESTGTEEESRTASSLIRKISQRLIPDGRKRSLEKGPEYMSLHELAAESQGGKMVDDYVAGDVIQLQGLSESESDGEVLE